MTIQNCIREFALSLPKGMKIEGLTFKCSEKVIHDFSQEIKDRAEKHGLSLIGNLEDLIDRGGNLRFEESFDRMYSRDTGYIQLNHDKTLDKNN